MLREIFKIAEYYFPVGGKSDITIKIPPPPPPQLAKCHFDCQWSFDTFLRLVYNDCSLRGAHLPSRFLKDFIKTWCSIFPNTFTVV